MKSYINQIISLVLVVFSTFMFSSCGLFKSAKYPPDAPYIKGGINFHLRGDSQLNMYQRIPHALVLCAYQLRDTNTFNQLMEEKDGMAKLLECGRFDSSVNYAKRLIVQPGQDIYEAMDKIEGANQIGIIAGYYSFQKKQAIKVIPLPMKGLPMFRKPGGIDIALYLTGQEIRNLTKDDQ